MSAEAPVVEAVALEATFPGGGGVGPVDLAIAPGEAVLVLGPSGSGKSTLLRLLHGAVPHVLHAQVLGSVRTAGRTVGSVRVAELADVVGVVGQDPYSGVCLPAVDEEVAFPLENLGVAPDAIGPAVEAALGSAGAAALRDRATTELSGGELQRVALAAAVAARPQLLLLDEPTSMLDARGVEAVRGAVEQALDGTGASCVIVEHRLDELAGDEGIAGLPRRWVVLSRDGRVVHDGTANSLAEELVRGLLAEGCWLPVELELQAIFGSPGGIGSEAVQHGLLALASSAEGAAAPEVRAQQGAVVLRARDVSVAAGRVLPGRERRTVLAGVDAQLCTGEVVALVGANGSGKSTLLSCLAGLTRPIRGEVLGPRAGLVFQNPEHQFAAATVRAEARHGLPSASADAVEAMLRRFGLADLGDRSPYRLSGGQQRRLSLAAMLLHDRPVLLADEPTFGLDRRGTVDAMRALRDAALAGRGVLFSSHDLRAVAGYADRVLVIGEGRLLADASPLALLREPALLRQAGMRPSALLRWLSARVADGTALRSALQRLDDLVLALPAWAGDRA